MTTDQKFMSRALDLARRGMGRTSPNPMVGCVIVKKGRVIAEGWHRAYGGDHAEVDALKKAGPRAQGAAMYVTLEPCAHWGKTPPCVDAVLAAGITRIVVAMKDPDPRTGGRSLRKLRTRGVRVVLGVGENEARELNAAFIKNATHKLPYVVAKTAQTMDGKVGTRSGAITWITCEATRNGAALRRAQFDAIVVGVNTVLSDDPRLNAPDRMLIKVVVDSRLRTPPTARLFEGANPGQVIIAAGARPDPGRMAALMARGAAVMICPGRDGRVDLKRLFKTLAKNGLIRILVDGGPTLVAGALKAGLVDRIHVYIAPCVMGRLNGDAVAGVDVARLFQDGKFEPVSVERMGPDIFIEADHVHRDH